jgi:abortive infection bacteriophage resistance protein
MGRAALVIMRYDKAPKSFAAQADLLLSRGLVADRDQLIRRLQVTSYFRLSGYLHPFREHGGDHYRAGTTLDRVWDICVFDQRLRTLLLDAIEAIEVHVRTQLAYHFAHHHGAFSYSDDRCLPNLAPDQFILWQRKLDDQVERSQRSREEFVTHFFVKYGDVHRRLPIWMLVELMDFGATLTFFRGVNDGIKKRVAWEVGQPDRVVMSWLLALNTVRNRCAHHLRLYNWELGTPVLIPQSSKFPDWHAPRLPNKRVGVILTLCRVWLNRISPANRWSQRVRVLFEEFPSQPIEPLGFTTDWQQQPLWRK